MRDPSHIFDLCLSLWQCQILNPLSKAWDQTASSWTLCWVPNPLRHNGNSWLTISTWIMIHRPRRNQEPVQILTDSGLEYHQVSNTLGMLNGMHCDRGSAFRVSNCSSSSRALPKHHYLLKHFPWLPSTGWRLLLAVPMGSAHSALIALYTEFAAACLFQLPADFWRQESLSLIFVLLASAQ